MNRSGVALALVLLVCACDRKGDAATDPASASSASAALSASAKPPEAPWYAGTWSGEFTVQRGKPEVESERAAPAEWRAERDGGALGKGTLKLTVDDDGNALATTEGLLGALDGRATVDEEHLSLRLRSRDDGEWSGILVLRKKDSQLTGELRVSSDDSLTLRRATVELSKTP